MAVAWCRRSARILRTGGLWHPTGGKAEEGEKDYVTTVQVFANPTEASNRFFSQLKQILKTAGNIEQEEILISRVDCWLM